MRAAVGSVTKVDPLPWAASRRRLRRSGRADVADRRWVMVVVRCALALLLAIGLGPAASAQVRRSDADTPAVSPLAPTLDRLDDELRQAVTSADDPASHWIGGILATLDPAERARAFGAAAGAAPGERLYVASLAQACLVRFQPAVDACDARDALAYWAVRDGDNAAPWLLLAERARQRRQRDVEAFLDRAAHAGRFDDYSERSAALFATRLAELPGARSPAVVAVAAARLAERAFGSFGSIIGSLCAARARELDANVASACLGIATLLVDTASNGVDRATGAGLAIALAATPSARAVAEIRYREIALGRQRCADAFASLAQRAAGAPESPGANAAAKAWIADRAQLDEFAACDRLAAALGEVTR